MTHLIVHTKACTNGRTAQMDATNATAWILTLPASACNSATANTTRQWVRQRPRSKVATHPVLQHIRVHQQQLANEFHEHLFALVAVSALAPAFRRVVSEHHNHTHQTKISSGAYHKCFKTTVTGSGPLLSLRRNVSVRRCRSADDTDVAGAGAPDSGVLATVDCGVVGLDCEAELLRFRSPAGSSATRFLPAGAPAPGAVLGGDAGGFGDVERGEMGAVIEPNLDLLRGTLAGAVEAAVV